MSNGPSFRLCATVAAFLVYFSSASTSIAASTTAKAIAFVANGFVIAATVTDPGSGYVAVPEVQFQGGGGTGAVATAQISAAGTVTNIVVTSAGSGYSGTPTIVISPPDTLAFESIRLVPMLTLTGAIGANVVVQYTTDLDIPAWQNLSTQRISTTPFIYFDTNGVSGEKRFYRGLVTTQFTPDTNQYALIPAGSFVIGSPESEPGRGPDESPQTTVNITHSFYIGRYEVTVAQYRAALGLPPATDGSGSHPITDVSWVEATNFCAQLTTEENQAGRLPAGMIYRLPTEAEWEYACRAGTTTPFFFGSSSTSLSQYAWCEGSVTSVQNVGQKLANPWGLYDIYGNTGEWCNDWYGPYPGGTVTDPTGPASGTYRTNRGGNYAETAAHCRSAFRGYGIPQNRYGGFLGIRVVLGAPLNQ